MGGAKGAKGGEGVAGIEGRGGLKGLERGRDWTRGEMEGVIGGDCGCGEGGRGGQVSVSLEPGQTEQNTQSEQSVGTQQS